MILKRIAKAPEAVYGVLLSGGIPFAVTLEDADRNNARSISCIPAGEYICKRFHSQKHPNTFQVMGVPGRDGILFHTGNTDEDTQGCILVGESFDPVKGEAGITHSGDGFAEFMKLCKDVDSFSLTIVEV